MKTVVGLCGKMGSGKDTAAQILKLYGFKHLAFAWHIKKFAQEVFRLSDESLWGASNLRNEPQTVYLDSWGASYNFFQARKNFLTKLGLDDFDYEITESLRLACDPFIRPNGALVEDKYLTLIPRDILRAVGDWGRGIDQNLWVKATLKEADHFDKVVISDVRYQNEAEAINNFNHKSGVIKIVAQAPGIVSGINVYEGQEVVKGGQLLSLSSNYQGGNAAAVQAQIAKNSYNLAKDTNETQKDLINKQREIANKTDAEL